MCGAKTMTRKEYSSEEEAIIIRKALEVLDDKELEQIAIDYALAVTEDLSDDRAN